MCNESDDEDSYDGLDTEESGISNTRGSERDHLVSNHNEVNLITESELDDIMAEHYGFDVNENGVGAYNGWESFEEILKMRCPVSTTIQIKKIFLVLKMHPSLIQRIKVNVPRIM